MDVVPVMSSLVKATILALRQILTQQGLSDFVVSDNGPPFAGTHYLEFLIRNGISRMSVPHTSQHQRSFWTGGTNHQLKVEENLSWNFGTNLAGVLFHYRTMPHDVTERAP